MLKTFTSTLFLSFLITAGASAQSSAYQKAYIVQQSDTIHGYIRSASDEELSKTIEFKTDLASEAVTQYKPGDITAFHFDDTDFHYASVTVDLLKGSATQQTQRFAKMLLSGYSNLYKLQLPEEEQAKVFQQDNTHLYILEKGSEYYTLGYYEIHNGNTVDKHKRYIGVMRVAFLDCKNYQDNLDQIRFDDNSVIAAVVKYNTSMDPAGKSTVYKYKAKTVFKHGIEASFANSYTPKNPHKFSLQGASLGYFWDIIQPDKSRRHSLKVGVSYIYYSYDFQDQNEKKVSGALHTLRFPISGQYHFTDVLTSSIVPFLNVGVTPMLSSKLKSAEALPLFHLGFGLYQQRIRYAIQIENDMLKFSTPKVFNFSVGLRLDK